MTDFDPTQHKPKQFDDSPLPAGRYLMVLEHIERKRGKESGRPYIRGRYRIIHGPLKGRTFFSSIGIDLSQDGTAGRLSAFCAAIGLRERFNIEDDNSLRRAWLNRPFKAEISQKKNGNYVNNDIRKYAIDEKDASKAEREFMASWRAEFLQKQEMEAGGFGDDDDDFGDGDDFGGNFSGGSRGDDDDDIPF